MAVKFVQSRGFTFDTFVNFWLSKLSSKSIDQFHFTIIIPLQKFLWALKIYWDILLLFSFSVRNLFFLFLQSVHSGHQVRK